MMLTSDHRLCLLFLLLTLLLFTVDGFIGIRKSHNLTYHRNTSNENHHSILSEYPNFDFKAYIEHNHDLYMEIRRLVMERDPNQTPDWPSIPYHLTDTEKERVIQYFIQENGESKSVKYPTLIPNEPSYTAAKQKLHQFLQRQHERPDYYGKHRRTLEGELKEQIDEDEGDGSPHTLVIYHLGPISRDSTISTDVYINNVVTFANSLLLDSDIEGTVIEGVEGYDSGRRYSKNFYWINCIGTVIQDEHDPSLQRHSNRLRDYFKILSERQSNVAMVDWPIAYSDIYLHYQTLRLLRDEIVYGTQGNEESILHYKDEIRSIDKGFSSVMFFNNGVRGPIVHESDGKWIEIYRRQLFDQKHANDPDKRIVAMVGSTLSCEDKDVIVHVQTHAFLLRTGYFAYRHTKRTHTAPPSSPQSTSIPIGLSGKRHGINILDTILYAYFNDIFSIPNRDWNILIRIYEINLTRIILASGKYRVSSLLTMFLEDSPQRLVHARNHGLDDITPEGLIDWSLWKEYLCPIQPEYEDHMASMNPTAWCEWWSQPPLPIGSESVSVDSGVDGGVTHSHSEGKDDEGKFYFPLVKWGGTQMRTIGFLCPNMRIEMNNQLAILLRQYPSILFPLLRYPEVLVSESYSVKPHSQASTVLYEVQKDYLREISANTVYHTRETETKGENESNIGSKVCFLIQMRDSDLLALLELTDRGVERREERERMKYAHKDAKTENYDVFVKDYFSDALDCKL